MQYLSFLAILAFQAYAAVHALERGYHFPIVALIFFTPLVGPFAYFAYEHGPAIYYRLRRYARKVFKSAPSSFKELARLQHQVKNQPNSENQHRLAKLYHQIGQFHEAIVLIDNVLSQKAFTHCPYLLLDKAHAYFAMEDFSQTKATLDFLFNQNASFHCAHAQLLMARTLSAMDEWQLANREFERLQSHYHGLEASFYYLQHLRKLDNQPRAHEVLKHMRHQFQRMPQHHRASQKSWLTQAEREHG